MFQFDNLWGEHDRLRGFVQTTEKLVSTAIADGYWSLTDPPLRTKVRLAPEVLEDARAALEEFNRQGHVHDIMVAIDRTPFATLHAHGLSGDQLRFKLKNIEHRERRLRARPFFRPLKRLVHTIDTLLQSILEAVPAGGALRELKDAALDATEDGREPRNG